MRIDVEVLKEAAILCGPNSSFHRILMQGLAFEEQGLTPVYLFDVTLGVVEVTTEEKIDKKYN